MPGQIFDHNAPSLRGGFPRDPQDLPHGLITPPDEVRALLAADKAKFLPQVYSPEVEERLLNDWTLQYYFDCLSHEVIYRQTPQGPEVIAVGDEELIALKKTMPLEEQLKLSEWLPY
jgi:hypothetical protein